MHALQDSAVIDPPAASSATARLPEGQLQRWLLGTLDEVDYGVIMVDADRHLRHLNYAARVQLGENHPLRVEAGRLHARAEPDARALATALHDAAARCRRCLLRLNASVEPVVAAVVPLPDSGVVIVLPKPKSCGALALQWFAHCYGLSPTERQVLQALCEGAMPADVAKRHEVAMSTVRTQIGSIRLKTGATSIRALLRQVAALPPIVSTLRGLGQ